MFREIAASDADFDPVRETPAYRSAVAREPEAGRASAKLLCACSPPNGTSSSTDASPASTAPYVSFAIETSATIGSLPALGMPIASGIVPTIGGPPSG